MMDEVSSGSPEKIPNVSKSVPSHASVNRQVHSLGECNIGVSTTDSLASVSSSWSSDRIDSDTSYLPSAPLHAAGECFSSVEYSGDSLSSNSSDNASSFSQTVYSNVSGITFTNCLPASSEILSDDDVNPTSSEGEILSSSQFLRNTVCVPGKSDAEEAEGCVATIEQMEERSVELCSHDNGALRLAAGVFRDSNTDWGRLGARPKIPVQHPPPEQIPPEVIIPVSDGLGSDFLARHSRDRTLQEGLCRGGDDTVYGTYRCVGFSGSSGGSSGAVVISSSTGWLALDRANSNTLTLGPCCDDSDNNHSTDFMLNMESGPHSLSLDDSLVAHEQRIAEACAIRERGERELSARRMERREQMMTHFKCFYCHHEQEVTSTLLF